MTPLTLLMLGAAVFFAAHVFLLFTSFGRSGYNGKRYLWSHLTLWICGTLLFTGVSLYAGTGESPIADAFDTRVKQTLIPVVILALSAVAHVIVKLFVMPKYQGR
jgi:hypothetical protein